MGVRGSAREVEMVRRPEFDFRNAVQLIQWHMTEGRARMGGLKAQSYEPSIGGERNPFATEALHVRFGLSSKCMEDLDARSETVLEAAYGEGLSDQRIAFAFGVSETTVRRWRNEAVRTVELAAVRLGVIDEPAVPR